MFRVISSRLIVKDGKLKASILLSGTGYDYLYTGTAAEAAAADEKSWIAPTGSETYTDTKTGAEKTGYRFEIPVEELDKQMDVAVRSAKKKTWADKTVTIHSTDAIVSPCYGKRMGSIWRQASFAARKPAAMTGQHLAA